MATLAPRDYNNIETFFRTYLAPSIQEALSRRGFTSFRVNQEWLSEHFGLTLERVLQIWEELGFKEMYNEVEFADLDAEQERFKK